jgi:HNH endonuclease
MPKKTVEERFWEKVDKNGPTMPHMATPCWVWTGGRHKQGYGLFQYATRTTRRAHRVAWAFENGPILEGKDVLHECDNEPCVRHLYLGTPKDNGRDRAVRGRAASGDRHPSRLYPELRPRGDAHWARRHPEITCRGERHGRAKLTADDVRAIRRRAASGETKAALSRAFGVSDTNIHDIVSLKTWREVEG